MTTDKKKKIAAKIRALLAKTVDGGCTEAEAMAAADMARHMMDKYQMSMTEAQLQEEEVVRGDGYAIDKYNIANKLGHNIALFCDVKVWVDNTYNSDGNTQEIVYFGLASDVDFAKWLTASLEAFITVKANQWAETNNTRKSYQSNGNAGFLRRAFIRGALQAINSKLRSQIEARKDKKAKTSDGTSIVVVKNAMVNSAFNSLGLALQSAKHEKDRSINDRGATHAGLEAGSKATFNRPVHGNTDGTLQIGSK